MAEVRKEYLDNIQNMDSSDLKNPLVFVIDMINGFVKEGALADSRIMNIVPNIQMLLEKVEDRVFICDSHPEDAREFVSYPTHCVVGSKESEVIDELKGYINGKVVLKNSTNAFFAPVMQEILKNDLDQYQDLVLVGCCSDICVLTFALCLNTYFNEHQMVDKRIIVPINMIETYGIEGVHDHMKWNEVACDIMSSNGIQVVNVK
ncbi:MAG: cysteine hydrolase [Erysipelotrichaceae bacterium]|nr:cysteine hydrolase [Erysipelotrichaceae bacterium]